jgi:hypothetical protein
MARLFLASLCGCLLVVAAYVTAYATCLEYAGVVWKYEAMVEGGCYLKRVFPGYVLWGPIAEQLFAPAHQVDAMLFPERWRPIVEQPFRSAPPGPFGPRLSW